jgi:CheY-like chemotaxis protein
MHPAFSVLVGSSVPEVSACLRMIIEHVAGERFEVHFADRDNWQALASYADEHGFDLLLINLTATIDHNRCGRSMGEMTAENVRQFKARYRNPIIILTSWDEPGLFPRLEAAGASAVISMPFLLSALVPHIERCISQASSAV